MDSMLGIIIPVGVAVLLLAVIFVAGYVKASPDTAIIISGLRKNPKVLIGKAGVKIPFLERKDALNLQLIPIDVKTASAVPTADYININVDATVNVKISDDETRLKLAAQNFLNKNPEYIGKVAREVLEGNVREIVGKMALEEMVSDRQKFANLVKENAEPDLAAMGLDIISFNVQNFVDGNGVIENLGVDNIVKIQKNAAISRAESEKEIAKAQANAKKEANDAQVEAEKEIAKANALLLQEREEANIAANTKIALKQNELDIKKAELQREVDTKQAIADAAKSIQAEEQRQVLEEKTADANLIRQEKAIELQAREVEITEKTLEAEIKKKAEAEKYATQQRADAKLYETQKNSEAELFERQKQAEAHKVEAEKKAEADLALAKADAEAKKALADAVKAQGEAEAAAAKAKGLAEAEAIKAKAEAEAEGLMKKAEAMKQYGEAAMADMQMEAIKLYFEQLPAIAKAVGEGYQGVDKIVMLGSDSGQLAGNIMNTTTQISEGLSESIGMDLKSMLAGFLGGKMAGQPQNTTVVVPTPAEPNKGKGYNPPKKDYREVDNNKNNQ